MTGNYSAHLVLLFRMLAKYFLLIYVNKPSDLQVQPVR